LADLLRYPLRPEDPHTLHVERLREQRPLPVDEAQRRPDRQVGPRTSQGASNDRCLREHTVYELGLVASSDIDAIRRESALATNQLR